jgi:dipeptidyl aminopeptidase/acylaminoacyl peptidase
VPAQAGSLAEDAKLFGTRPAASHVAMSPSGNKVVMLVAGPGSSTMAKVFDLMTGAVTTPVTAPGRPEKLSWCEFATDAQLVCQYGGNVEMEAGQIVGFSRLITVGADGKGLKMLGEKGSAYDARLRQFDGKVLDWLPGDQGSILMAKEFIPEAGRTGSNISRSRNGLGVDRIDLASVKNSTVEPPDKFASGYMSDGRGNVRIRLRSRALDDGTLTGVTTFSYRVIGSRDWRDLGEYDARTDQGIYPVAIEAESNSVLVLKKLNGRDALYRIALDESGTTTLVAKNDAVDIAGVSRFGRGQRVIAYNYSDDRGRTVYFDPEFDRLSGSLGKALPSSPLIDFTGASSDGNSLLIFAGSDTNPGTYYFLDRKTKEMADIADVRPGLKSKALSPVKAVTYKSRDGATIPAYVTLPAGSTGKGLPAVVLPHGGPSARDEWGFDWLAQFLAARGYAVIQPNYRGSSGYGEEFQNENGFRNWRTAIADVTDSARYLVEQGIADKQRLAIVGWSYGGYAALQSATVEPDLFKAVVAIAPVTDLSLLKREAEGFTNSELVKDMVGSGEHIRAGSPLRNAASIKVPVLLVHGDLDSNVGIDHSVKMASALKSAGKQVEFLSYKGLDHNLEDSNARIEMLSKMGETLDKAIGH